MRDYRTLIAEIPFKIIKKGGSRGYSRADLAYPEMT